MFYSFLQQHLQPQVQSHSLPSFFFPLFFFFSFLFFFFSFSFSFSSYTVSSDSPASLCLTESYVNPTYEMRPLRLASLLAAISGVVQGAPFVSGNEADSSDLIARQQTTVVGHLDLLPAFQTCSSQRFNIIRSALTNVHLLTDAVQGVSGADPSLQSFFGVGWVGRKYPTYFAMIADNLLKAGIVTRQSGPFLAKVSCEDVENRCSKTPSPIAYTTGQTDDAGKHTIVACPKFFQNIGVTKHAQSLADVQKLKPTTDLQRVDTYEHYLLHEILHLTNAGYKTAVSPPGIGDDHSESHLPYITRTRNSRN